MARGGGSRKRLPQAKATGSGGRNRRRAAGPVTGGDMSDYIRESASSKPASKSMPKESPKARVSTASRRGGKPQTNTGKSRVPEKKRGIFGKLGNYVRSRSSATEETRKKLGIT